MKNKIKLLLPILLLIIAIPVLYTVIFNKNNNTTDDQLALFVTEDYLEDENFLEEMHKQLLNKYGENYAELFERNAQSAENADKIREMFQKDENSEPIYPDFIGGLYINDDDYLVIQIVKENIPSHFTKEYFLYENILNIDKYSIVEYVKYSYSELNTINSEISKKFIENNTNISTFYIDVINNKLTVELKENSKSEVAKFKSEIVNSNTITFINEEELTSFANLNPGAKLGTYNASIGFRAKLNGKNGIVTAGHSVIGPGLNTSVAGIGTLRKRAYTNNSNIDAAFIETNSSNIPTNTLSITPYQPGSGIKPTTISTNTPVSSFTVGQRLAKIGIKTGFTEGTVTVVSQPVTTDLFYLTQQVRTNIAADKYDSGGIVFVYPVHILGTVPAGGYRVAGIVAGGNTNGTNMYFTRASYIMSAWGLTRY